MKDYGWFSFLRRLHKRACGRNAGRKLTCQWMMPRLEHLEERIALDDNSAGANGINARNLGLTGQGIHIGQVEFGRPGLKAIGDNNNNSHPDVTPAVID